MTADEEAPSDSWVQMIEDRWPIKLGDGPNVVIFLDNRVARKVHPASKSGELQWVFLANIDGMVGEFYTRSKNLLAMLKQHHPLRGKEFVIERTGTGVRTRYSVQWVAERPLDTKDYQEVLPLAWR